MKTSLLTTLYVLFFSILLAQTPETFKYQAVIRNNQGKVLVNQPDLDEQTLNLNGNELSISNGITK